MSKHRRPALALLAAVICASTFAPTAFASDRHAAAKASRSAVYLVGGAATSINPTRAMLKNKDFYLGGYGFGDDKVLNKYQIPATSGRYATGILKDGVHSRALMISDRHNSIAFAQIETQGYFISYKQGPFGIEDIRKDASAQIYALAAAQHQVAIAAQTYGSTQSFWFAAGMLLVAGLAAAGILNVRHEELATDGQQAVHVG